MSSAGRSVVYSLLTVVFVLLLGMGVLLWVANRRHQRLEDETADLRRSLHQQIGQIDGLRQRLEDCMTNNPNATDTALGKAEVTRSAIIISRP